MKILVVAPGKIFSVPPSQNNGSGYGGSEAHTHDLLSGLKSLNIEADLLAPEGSKNPAGKVISCGPVTGRWGGDDETANIAFKHAGNYDVIHSHLYYPEKLYEHRALAQPHTIKLLHTMLGISAWPPGYPPHWQPKANLVTLGAWHRQDTMARIGLDSATVPCAVDFAPYDAYYKEHASSASKDHLLFFGLLCNDKAPDEAIKIAREHKIKNLVVAGEANFVPNKDYVEWIRTLCEENGYAFIPSPSNEEKMRLMMNAKALILPFRAPQTGSLLAIEALALGTEVFNTQHGGLAELPTQPLDKFLSGKYTIRTPEECRKASRKAGNDCVEVAQKYSDLYWTALGGNGW